MDFRAFVVRRDEAGVVRGALESCAATELLEGEVRIAVSYSAINYKDVLSAAGHPGVTRRFPHVPGIDAAGLVMETRDARFRVGDTVLVTGFDLGMNTWGGFAEQLRVPADWVVPLPSGLSLRTAMILGTAGLTAALATEALGRHGVSAAGPVLVTGATGGVGSLAVRLLAQAGHPVAAATGKAAEAAWLQRLGACEVVSRARILEPPARGLASARWGAAFDTVGGATLSAVLAAMHYGAPVAACGMVSGAELVTTVYPFILRAVALIGIDSVAVPLEVRRPLWDRLAQADLPWDELAHEVTLDEIGPALEQVARGQTRGRLVVRVRGAPDGLHQNRA